jgi:hypothetical protein
MLIYHPKESADSFSPGVVQAIRNSGQEECSILQVVEIPPDI